MKKENFRYCPQKRKGQKRKKSIKREGQIGIKRIHIEITPNIFLKLSINKNELSLIFKNELTKQI